MNKTIISSCLIATALYSNFNVAYAVEWGDGPVQGSNIKSGGFVQTGEIGGDYRGIFADGTTCVIWSRYSVNVSRNAGLSWDSCEVGNGNDDVEIKFCLVYNNTVIIVLNNGVGEVDGGRVGRRESLYGLNRISKGGLDGDGNLWLSSLDSRLIGVHDGSVVYKGNGVVAQPVKRGCLVWTGSMSFVDITGKSSKVRIDDDQRILSAKIIRNSGRGTDDWITESGNRYKYENSAIISKSDMELGFTVKSTAVDGVDRWAVMSHGGTTGIYLSQREGGWRGDAIMKTVETDAQGIAVADGHLIAVSGGKIYRR